VATTGRVDDEDLSLTGPVDREVRPTRWRSLEIFGLVLTTLVGLAHLPMPFGGDAALMTTVGRQLAGGAVLYRDLLDIRQPIIFWFARFGGELFGFTEPGIHLAELIVLVAGSVAMVEVIRPHVRSRWAPALAPMFTVGIYYLAAEVWQLTEPESFAGLPLLAIAWIIDRLSGLSGAHEGTWASAVRRRPASMPRLLMALGALTAIVGLLKLTYLAIAGAMALIVLVDGWRRRRLMSVIIWPTAGFLAVVGPFALYLWWRGVLGDVMWLWFDYAPSTLDRAPRTVERLQSGAWRFARMWLAVLAFSMLGIGAAFRGRPVDRLLMALVVWIVSGLGTILVQHWWDYLFHVLIVPLGLLAVVGLDEMVHRSKDVGSRMVGGIVFVVLLIPLGSHFATKAGALLSNGLGFDQVGRDAIHDDFAERYADARDWREDLGDDQRPVHFVGDATSIWVAGRDQAIPVHGWAADFLDDELWSRMTSDIAMTRPAHLWLWEGTYGLMDRRSPATRLLVEREYCFVRSYGDHDWWVLRSEIDTGITPARCA